ncbi:hypothetical protein [Mucilaginibacter gossypiicola]|uniref:hypothetical protein n=1 Tax=Mucilaginibacter gossypiicola TaxID=551995 RepID=UPI001430DB91|nr:hypothetical protein [Mucilaginibacter gossypiicola]
MSLRVTIREILKKNVMTCKIHFRDGARAALGMGADTGLWLMPAQYERTARPQATPIL